MPTIRFENITKDFRSADQVAGDGSTTGAAVRNISLQVEDGEFVVLLGPSGCGKTTLMRMVNRLIEPTSGSIYLDDVEIHKIRVTDLRRHIGYVIQQVGLFPHMTVARNVAVVPKLLGWPKDRIRNRTRELLELVDLPPDQYWKRYPRQLSGGQQQRVGIARAMAADPSVLLMDEPFGAIDAITRADLQTELLNIQRKVSKTVIFVTHDVEEALRLADRIAIMRTGEVVQYDTPLQILTNPADDFVRNLVGAQDVFRQLSLVPVTAVMRPLDGERIADDVTISEDDDVRRALSTLIASGAHKALVVNAAGETVGFLTLDALLSEGTKREKVAEGNRS